MIIPFAGIDHDTFPRRDTSLEKLGKLPAVFDRTGGSITAGNSSPLTDGAASIWVGDSEGLARLGAKPAVKLVDWEVDAVDFRVDGMLMAPARAIPRLLARHRLRAEEIALWEIHEAFAAQLIANLKAAADPVLSTRESRGRFRYRLVPSGSHQSKWRIDRTRSSLRLHRRAHSESSGQGVDGDVGGSAGGRFGLRRRRTRNRGATPTRLEDPRFSCNSDPKRYPGFNRHCGTARETVFPPW